METSASSKAMNNFPKNAAAHKIQGIESTMREKTMGTQTMGKVAGKKFMKGCAICAAFLALGLTSPRVHAAAASEASASAEEQQGKQRSGDRVVVTLSDPSRPSNVKASLINGGITVKAYEGNTVIVDAQ